MGFYKKEVGLKPNFKLKKLTKDSCKCQFGIVSVWDSISVNYIYV